VAVRAEDSRSLSAVQAGLAHAGAAFKSGEELFEALAAHTSVGIFVASAEGGCVYVNERWCELTGLTPDQAKGDGWLVALHPEDAPRVHREWAEAAAHGHDSVTEYRFVRPDGSVSWIEGFAASLRDDSRRVIGWVGTCLDSTERKEAEEAVARAAERFRVAFDSAPIGMTLVTPEGRFLQVNPALCELLGYSADELTRLTFVDVTHPDDIEASIEHNRRQLEGEVDDLRIEKRYLRADGQVVWASVASTLARSDKGEPLHIVAQIEDVTERVLTRRALEEAEERFRRAFEDAPIGMALVSVEGRWLQVNRTLCEITGYSEDELLARTFQDITHPEDLEDNLDQVDRVVAGDARFMRIEKRYLRPNGQTVWVRVSTSLVYDADGAPLHFVSQIEDVTDRKRAEHKLKDLADHDSLTGLLNRRRFDEELDLALLKLRRHGGRAALLLIDLDRFKLVNDTFGHKTGDELLVAAAAALRGRLRATDVVARLGGDEFAVLLFEIGAEAAGVVANDLVTALRSKRIVSEAGEVGVTASIGVVLLDQDTLGNEDDALVAADHALYRAKSGGRDQISFTP
jgi:diguanylate cyclase (GGDEF)-like protein/PAS domain S-box-containing protein